MAHYDFLYVSGSTIGRDHRTVPKNNQDGMHILSNEHCTVAVVADGCGSTAHSEVGAKLGVRLACQTIAAYLRFCKPGDLPWASIVQDMAATLRVLFRQLGEDFAATVNDFSLFTIVGMAMTDDEVTFFAFGDGVIVINGQIFDLGPFAGNAPPYLGYTLLLDRFPDLGQIYLQMRVVQTLPLDLLQHFLIGTDGVLDLMKAEQTMLPGLDQPVGPLSQFWNDDKIFANPALLERRLKLIGRDWPKRDPQPGLLHDDTTIIVGRSGVLFREET